MKTLLTTLLLAITLNSFAQRSIDISLQQDAKLAFIGDDKNNDAPTLNVVARLDMQGKQDRLGYFVLGPEFEYADLHRSRITRYSITAGYTFNKWLNNSEFNIRAGYGVLNREGFAFRAISVGTTYSYEIFDNFRLLATLNLYERNDKDDFYGDDASYTINPLKMDLNGLIGVSYRFKTR